MWIEQSLLVDVGIDGFSGNPFQDNGVEHVLLQMLPHLETTQGEEDILDPSSLYVCATCLKWREQHLPMRPTVEIIFEKTIDESWAKEVTYGLNAAAGSEEKGGPLSAGTWEELGRIVQEEYELKTYQEVVEAADKTPIQLKLKPLHRVILNGKPQTLWGFPPEGRPSLKCLVFHKESGVCQKADMSAQLPNLFPSHGTRLVQDLAGALFKQNGISDFSYQMASWSETVARAKELTRKEAEAKAHKQRLKSSDWGIDVGADEPVQEQEKVEEEGEVVEAMKDIHDEPERTGVIVSKEGGGKAKAAASSSTGTTVALPAVPARRKPVKILQSQVSAPLGTALHWIQRSPLGHAALGDEMKRETNQLSLLRKNTATPRAEKNLIDQHTANLSLTTDMWHKNLPRRATHLPNSLYLRAGLPPLIPDFCCIHFKIIFHNACSGAPTPCNPTFVC